MSKKVESLVASLQKKIEKADDFFGKNKEVILEYFKLEEEKKIESFKCQEKIEMLIDSREVQEDMDILNEVVEVRVRPGKEPGRRVSIFETKFYKKKPKYV